MSRATEDIDAVYAGELVLGVLDAQERARATKRAKADPTFADLVNFWHQKLAPLSAEISAVTPPAALKKKIASALFASDDRRLRNRLRASRSFWRLTAVAMTAVATTAVGALFYFVL